MLPSGISFPEVASRLTHSTSNGSLGSAGRPPRAKPVQRSRCFGCGSEPSVLTEFEPSFHDPSVRDPSTKGRGDYSNHADVDIIADLDSYVEYAHLSPMSVARRRRQQTATVQQPQQMVSPFQQASVGEPSGSSDSASSTMFVENSTYADQAVAESQPIRHRDHTTHAGDQIPTNTYFQRPSKNNIMRTFSRGSIDEQLTPPYGAKQSTVHNVPVLGKRISIGEKMIRTLSRNSLGPRTPSVHLDKVSATHYGGQIDNMVPIRTGSGPPIQMIVDPTTHAEASFRQRQ